MYPDDLKNTSEHEWARAEGNRATIGITHYAQDALCLLYTSPSPRDCS